MERMSNLLELDETIWHASQESAAGVDAAGQPVNILLVEDSEDEALLVEAMLQDAGQFRLRWVANLSAGMQHLSTGGVDVVLLDLGLPDGKGPDSFYRMSRAARNVPIVVLTGDNSRLTEEAVKGRGAQQFLVKQQIGTQELVRAIMAATQRSRNHGNQLDGGSGPAGRIIGFVGAKGGVGATSLVLNVAGALAQLKYKTVAVELPDVPSGFALHLGRPFARLLQRWSDIRPENMGRTAIEHFLVRMPFGAEVLFAPQSADMQPILEYGRISAALFAMAERSDYVLADIGTAPTPAAWETISGCDYLVLVVDREPTSVHAAKRWLQWFRLKGISDTTVGTVVVNRSGLPTNTSMQSVAREVGCPLVGVIPSAGEHMASASTRQEILLQFNPDTLSAASLMDTAMRLSAKNVQPIAH